MPGGRSLRKGEAVNLIYCLHQWFSLLPLVVGEGLTAP